MNSLRPYILALFAAILVILPAAAAHTVSDIPNVHVADRTRYVSNPDGVLSARAVAELDTMLARVWAQSSAEVVVVAVDDIDPTGDIDSFATDLFETWGIGKEDKDNGVLILIARDSRKAVIRTGQGIEGAIPDIIAGRILRNVMFPRFREGDYDGGTLAATREVARIATDPRYADELRSRYANDSRTTGPSGSTFDSDEFFSWYAGACGWIGGIALIIVIFLAVKTRKKDTLTAYRTLESARLPLIIASCVFLCSALPALLILLWRMKRIRNHARHCPNCHAKMRKLDEESDNAYLTPAQDAEERHNSIDYDVWLCPECGETDIIPYINKKSSYTNCERCGARLSTLTANRTLTKPTTRSEGQGVRTYTCLSCGHAKNVYYKIPKVVNPPIVIIPGGGGGRGFGGGGFGGGSFGGGSTMGGGASGSW